MNDLTQLKQISCIGYLAQCGYFPVKEDDKKAMFRATWRSETEASVKVDKLRNIWIDYGTRKGGSIIDLAMTLRNCNESEAIKSLQSESYSTFIPSIESISEEPAIHVTEVRELYDYRLKDYVQSRGVRLDIVNKYCQEVHYKIGGNSKDLYSLGLRNNSNGFALRNQYGKKCTNSDYTRIKGTDSDRCTIVEGMFELLTLAQLYNPQGDIIVLNSTVNACKVEPLLKNYKIVNLLLNNDSSGTATTNSLIKAHSQCVDWRGLLNGRNDLNELLTIK